MNILVIGRSDPLIKDNSIIGKFEKEQAVELSKIEGVNVNYLFFDDSSLKINRFIKKSEYKTANLYVNGVVLPIGGIPYNIKFAIKESFYKKHIKELIKRGTKPDVVHIHYPIMTVNLSFVLFLKDIGCKVVFTEHWSKVQSKSFSKVELENISKIYNNADKIISVSGDLKNSIEDISKRTDVEVIPNMVNGEPLSIYAKQESELSSFIFVGRLVKVKKVDLLINAFKIIYEKYKNVRLIIIGDGLEKKYLEELVYLNSLENVIEFKGYLQPKIIRQYLKTSNYYVSASELETFGVPFIEAWMEGLPIIAANNSPIRQYVREWNGILFNTNSVNSLAEKMEEVLNKNFSNEKINKFALDLFESKAVIDKIIELYKKL